MRPHRSLRRLVLSLVALVAVIASPLVIPAAPAAAETRVLCRGFTQCSSMGYGNANYHKYYKQMWWRMYGGHNCTNYAAYRMVRAGMSPERPWVGSGNASNWGIALADRTDQTPMVGSIAWWHGRNHVQVVEKVISRDRIVVSEDHWGGDFNWAEVRRGDGSNWPDGFIHLRDAQVQMRVAPTVTDTPQVGVPLTGNAGTWRPVAQLSYQWLRNGKPIRGATSLTFTPRPVDQGARLALYVIAKRTGYVEGKKTSRWTPAVVPGAMEVVAAPQITGFPKVTGTLTATPAQLEPAPQASSIQWLADGVAVPGATGGTIVLGSDLLGKRISVQVTATRAGYGTVTVASTATDAVGPERITTIERPRLAGTRLVGETMRVTPGRVDVANSTVTVQWRRNGVPFTNRSYYYTPTVDDLGDRITAWVVHSKTGYDPVTWKMNSPIVRSRPRIRFGSPAAGQVAVRVFAEGVSPVPGSVVLTDGAHAAMLSLVDGRAVFRHRWIGTGERKLTAVYRGSPLVASAERTAWVDVRR